jgi:hypothetical protein
MESLRSLRGMYHLDTVLPAPCLDSERYVAGSVLGHDLV